MLINQINVKDLSYQEFIEEFDKNIRFKSSLSKFNDYIETSLEFLLQFPKVKYLAYFKINPKNFLFDLYHSYPNDKGLLIKEYFDNLTSIGAIGQTIDTEKTVIYQNDDKFVFNDVVLCPILNKDNIYGIFIFVVEDLSPYNKEIIGKLDVFGRLLSYILESISYKEELKNIQGMLEQKVAERTLDIITSKRELQTILNSVNTGILVFDKINSKLIQANSIALQILQSNFQDIKDLQLNDFFNEEEFDQVAFSRNYESQLIFNNLNIPILRSTSTVTLGSQKLIIESFIDISRLKSIENKLKKSNEILEKTVQERTKDLEVLVNKLKNEIEERKKIEKEIKKTLDKEKELNDLKSSFISLVSHEFRTPLTLINSSAQIILSYKDRLSEDDIKKYLERIMDTVNYMTGLLENVIFIEKNERGNIKLDLRKIDISKSIQDLINEYKLSLKESREIKFNIHSKDTEFNTDENTLRHIIYNLLTNAHKYSPIDKEIIVELSDNNNEFIINVKDFGIGIPSYEQDKIFEQFYRGKNTGNISGTGLGMSVIMKSLQSLNGRLEIESEEGKGTSFYVYLPKKWGYDE